MQDINKDFKLLKVKGVDEDSVKNRIENRQFKIGKMKKIIWPLNIVIFLVHLITLSVSAKSESIHFIGALILLVVNILLVIAITWMKGAGTIDDNNRMSRSPWMSSTIHNSIYISSLKVLYSRKRLESVDAERYA